MRQELSKTSNVREGSFVDISSLESEREKLKAEIQTSEAMLRADVDKVNDMRNELRELEGNLYSISQQIERLTTAKADPDKITPLEIDKQKLEVDFNRKVGPRKNLESKIENQQKVISQKKKELSELNSRINHAEEQQQTFDKVNSISQAFLEDTSVIAEAYTLASEDWGNSHFTLGIAATTISAVIGAGIFANNSQLTLVAGILSLILVVISAVSTFLNAEKRSTDNYKAGIEFKCLSNAAETFVDVDLRLKEKPLAELAESLRVLKEKRDELLKKNPRVSLRYYKSAKNEYDKQKEAKEKRLVKVVSERFKNESKIGSSEIKTAA